MINENIENKHSDYKQSESKNLVKYFDRCHFNPSRWKGETESTSHVCGECVYCSLLIVPDYACDYPNERKK